MHLHGQGRWCRPQEAAGWLEQPRPWLETQWPGLFLGVSSRLEPPGAPWGGAGAELRQCAKGGSFGRAGARQEGVTQLLSARARRELGLDLERGQRRSVRARQPQLSGDEVRDEV